MNYLCKQTQESSVWNDHNLSVFGSWTRCHTLHRMIQMGHDTCILGRRLRTAISYILLLWLINCVSGCEGKHSGGASGSIVGCWDGGDGLQMTFAANGAASANIRGQTIAFTWRINHDRLELVNFPPGSKSVTQVIFENQSSMLWIDGNGYTTRLRRLAMG